MDMISLHSLPFQSPFRHRLPVSPRTPSTSKTGVLTFRFELLHIPSIFAAYTQGNVRNYFLLCFSPTVPLTYL